MGQQSVVKHLLAIGASPHASDDLGWKPLHWACDVGGNKGDGSKGENTGLSIVRLLVNSGSDPCIPTDGLPSQTPLHLGCRRGHADIAAFLIRVGAHVS
ncbi:unnamed protein product [Choristocarpus tenellus]